LPQRWKESVIVPACRRVKNSLNNYRRISLLATTYKNLSNILCQSELHIYTTLLRAVSMDYL